MSILSAAFTQQKLCMYFASLKTCCPKGIYVAPVPDAPLLWTGVLFVRKGPYANAVLRFQIDFPDDYPARPPIVTFQSDLFHPLVSPLTTYTHSTRDLGTDTQSAADEQRLPPGGLSLRHGFPEWFQSAGDVALKKEASQTEGAQQSTTESDEQSTVREQDLEGRRDVPHVVEVLQYLRIVLDTEEVLDDVPLNAVANAGAWHAWRSYRSKIPANRAAPVARSLGSSRDVNTERSTSPQQQPGGARRPGEWNWQGVWEDRVRRSVQASLSEPVLFGADNDVIDFLKLDQETIIQLSPLQAVDAS